MWLLSAHGRPVSGQVSMSCSSCRVSNDIRLVWNKDMGIGYIAMRNKLSYDCDIYSVFKGFVFVNSGQAQRSV